MHELSTVDNPKVYRLTSNQLATDSSRRRYRKLREALLEANPEISVAIDRLSMVNKKATTIEDYQLFLRARSRPFFTQLKTFYTNTLTDEGEVPLFRYLC
jgi:hypothetical protein